MTDPFNFLAGFSINFFILSLICGEARGWGWYNYTEAIVYTDYLDESVQNPEGKWTDFCSTGENYCFGLFCDEQQYLDENRKCKYSKYNIGTPNTQFGFVHFHDDSPNYTITTKSQEYLKELKARVNRNDSSVYVKEVADTMFSVYAGLFNRYLVAPYTFESNTMLFLVINESPKLALIDYHCSLVDIRFKVNEFMMMRPWFSFWVCASSFSKKIFLFSEVLGS
jgi:hypothetical protein